MLGGSGLSILLCLSVNVSPASSTHSARLTGTVEDTTGGMISGATIVVACLNDARYTKSDASGRFALSGLPAGRCSATGAHANFASTLVEVDLSSGSASTRLVLPVLALDDSVVVTPSGVRKPGATVPASTSVVSRVNFDMRPYQVLPQVLREEPGISVQQTTAAAASPMIRGFTGQSNIYLIDGVRMNTSMWRSGPVQYLAWLSALGAERLEIVRGPMSVQYGSDALGGAINVLLERPGFTGGPRQIRGAASVDLASADRAVGGEFMVALESSRASLMAGVARKSVGELRAGNGGDSHAAVTRFLGLPAADEHLQNTGYQQGTAQVTGRLRAGSSGVLSGVYRRDVQSGVRRYDRMNGGEGLFKSELTPQSLNFGFVRYETAAVPKIGALRATVSVNHQQDGTIEQARVTTRIDSERTAVLALGYQLQAARRFAGHLLVYGAERYDERIDASAAQQAGSTVTAVRPLIPDGTTYRSIGVFAQGASREFAGRVAVRAGVRYNAHVYQTEADPSLTVHAERLKMSAVTFNGAVTVVLVPGLQATFSAARGFRAANASDLGAIGTTGGAGFEISPSVGAVLGAVAGSNDGAGAVATSRSLSGLGPEKVHAFEMGLRGNVGGLNLSAALFDLELRDAIHRRTLIFPSDVVGVTISGREIVAQDSSGRASIAGESRPISTRVNSSRGRVRGFDLEGQLQLSSAWATRIWFSMAAGRDLETDSHLRRMNPPMGGAVLAWNAAGRGLRIEGVVTFAATQDRFAPADFSDARMGGRRTAANIAGYFNGRAVDLGLVRDGILQQTGETLAQVQTRLLGGGASSQLFSEAPGWTALGARAMYALSPRVDLILIAENLADRNFRLVGSGVDAPGRNVQVRLRLRF